MEITVLPLLNPGLFTGLREPPKGVLLFGPPGTGKTMIGKAIASVLNFTFFSISSSTLTSKWFGEAEKMVKALFQIAKDRQPSVIFIDEIDSLLCARTENENESTRRIKTEFMVQLDGAKTLTDIKVLFIGATNRPQELDDAVRRRFQKRLYIPLPNLEGRIDYFHQILETENKSGNHYDINDEQLNQLATLTKGYSCSDLFNLCKEAAMSPVREKLNSIDISNISCQDLRSVNYDDFQIALRQIKPSVSQNDVKQYLNWNNEFGYCQYNEEQLNT